MSQVFHKSCYTTRSSGYKYRTLSTNTGERKRRDSKEDCSVDKVFRDIRRAISTRIDTELEKTGQSREMIFDKFDKIDSKINTMLDLQVRRSLYFYEGTSFCPRLRLGRFRTNHKKPIYCYNVG